MSIFEAIVNHFNAHLDASSNSIETLTPYIAEAIHLFTERLTEDNKIICCTSGSAQAAGKQFCDQLLNSATLDRPSLPALYLDTHNSIALIDHNAIDETYARQIQALGNEGDLLFLISSSGQEKTLINAINTATIKKMHIVAITAGKSNDISTKIPASEVNIPIHGLSNIQTIGIQFLLAQILAELIEQQLFGFIDL